ncbi:MAG: hybrid sensor histidine kinase/response regulator, partial [Gammaproteobacteria bacterium]|nr:hybrid sensor histidine kinase/response regulator [Gammaproteobacteria bacterium]
ELLRQVLVNLLSNALKFTRDVSPALIQIAGERAGAQCQYQIADNGAGFDMRHAHKLFGMFERLHASNQFEGIGIGLSIVQRIVERHGGRISATGEVGKGACFTFTLPAAD